MVTFILLYKCHAVTHYSVVTSCHVSLAELILLPTVSSLLGAWPWWTFRYDRKIRSPGLVACFSDSFCVVSPRNVGGFDLNAVKLTCV